MNRKIRGIQENCHGDILLYLYKIHPLVDSLFS